MIKDDKDLVRIIDELKYKIKGSPQTHMIFHFNNILNDFIDDYNLDTDPHMFATLPKKVIK